ncbi:hypothetical protein B0A52_09828 [Exophiala mesophila]|uniref:Major facilitator superfamily (MFS) profile domain-containing protein n=1 Tax=Exophiala mesophila TaxID=212818 RepID=A0A438MSB4_EXOME|nr:hypothetical protein B0A52_09828 [Exophiala mesophila]
MATYPAEIMPTSMRPTGVAVAYMTQHVLIIILIQFTPIALETISWRFFLIFVCGSAIFAVVFYFFYPETRYKSLEEIEAIFGDKVAIEVEEPPKDLEDVTVVPDNTDKVNDHFIRSEHVKAQ